MVQGHHKLPPDKTANLITGVYILTSPLVGLKELTGDKGSSGEIDTMLHHEMVCAWVQPEQD